MSSSMTYRVPEGWKYFSIFDFGILRLDGPEGISYEVQDCFMLDMEGLSTDAAILKWKSNYWHLEGDSEFTTILSANSKPVRRLLISSDKLEGKYRVIYGASDATGDVSLTYPSTGINNSRFFTLEEIEEFDDFIKTYLYINYL